MPRVSLKSAVVLGACAWVSIVQVGARDEEVVARLTRQIDALAAFVPPGAGSRSPQALADSLIDGKARTQLFRLESLLRLYARAYSGLEKYRAEVKELEDGLGAYTFTVDSLKFATDKFAEQNRVTPPDAARKADQERVLEGLRKQSDTARGVFTTLAGKSSLIAELPKLRSLIVSHFNGWSTSKELGFVKGEVERMLKNVRDRRYDFNQLETGIHEFRRRLRWFPILVDALDGLILVRDDPPGACPVPALEKLAGSPAAKHRYSNPPLRFPATHACTISRCLLWQVVKTTNDLGLIKDEALGNESIAAALDNDIYGAVDKSVTRAEIERAKAIRAELFSTRALDALLKQVSSCKPWQPLGTSCCALAARSSSPRSWRSPPRAPGASAL